MRYFVWALRLIVFLAVLLFALKNTNPVAVTFFDGLSIPNVPLIVVMLSTFVLGTVFGLLLTVPPALRRRREIARLRKDLERLQTSTSPQGQAGLSPDALVPLSPM
ncbi:lipopolysaccharide assembly protein LapA domain-containing protein [Zwartia sp.]|uniref:LapA family protein n=1 Tax=Zwartia sp. TaxID=2978004 RepID=UPI00271C6FFB|nr:lipopolysaccharide assembly protein LapA domain-containing protein [Zwartia sp.]MDO9026145.1 lipopolysaccharide assembly protein LapA domain-containing protein [Zwartia sp.]